MSTNISKQKREDLLAKIKEIRSFIILADYKAAREKLLPYVASPFT